MANAIGITARPYGSPVGAYAYAAGVNERVSVEVVAAPTVNHAMAHNGLGFCHRIVVTTAVELTEVEITAELTDDFGTSAESAVAPPRAGDRRPRPRTC